MSSATHSRICSVKGALTALALVSGSALAAQDGDNDRPVTDDRVSAVDVATTPISDLNLKKDKIPPLLLAAQADPYATAGLRSCRQYVSSVEELDRVLGEDFDIAEQDQRKITVGRVAQSVVGSLIPFRGVIREVSGANKHERAFQDAILAGMMRRSFLKGMGLKLGCAYPARPASDAVRQRIADERAASEADSDDDG